MDTTLRVMIINYGSTEQAIKISFDGGGTVEVFQMTKPPADSAAPMASVGRFDTSPFKISVPAGEIYGYRSATPTTVIKPATSSVNVITAAGKDPWPPPPLAPSGFSGVWDWQARYFHFLATAGAPGTEPVIQMAFSVLAPQVLTDLERTGHHGHPAKAGK